MCKRKRMALCHGGEGKTGCIFCRVSIKQEPSRCVVYSHQAVVLKGVCVYMCEIVCEPTMMSRRNEAQFLTERDGKVIFAKRQEKHKPTKKS